MATLGQEIAWIILKSHRGLSTRSLVHQQSYCNLDSSYLGTISNEMWSQELKLAFDCKRNGSKKFICLVPCQSKT